MVERWIWRGAAGGGTVRSRGGGGWVRRGSVRKDLFICLGACIIILRAFLPPHATHPLPKPSFCVRIILWRQMELTQKRRENYSRGMEAD